MNSTQYFILPDCRVEAAPYVSHILIPSMDSCPMGLRHVICRPSLRTSQSSIIAYGFLVPYRRIERYRTRLTSPFISSYQSNAYISVLCVHRHLSPSISPYLGGFWRHVVCRPSLQPLQSCIVALVPVPHRCQWTLYRTNVSGYNFVSIICAHQHLFSSHTPSLGGIWRHVMLGPLPIGTSASLVSAPIPH